MRTNPVRGGASARHAHVLPAWLRECFPELLLVAPQHRDVDIDVRASLVTEEHVERAATRDPPRRRHLREQLFHLLAAQRLPPMLRRRGFRVLHQNPSLYTRSTGMR